MSKKVFIAEKPSVAAEFAKALKVNTGKRDGYIENDNYIVTWCVGHLVTMSYPDVYDEALKRWSLDTIPFIPDVFKYEVIEGVKKQYSIVKGLLSREDVDSIYVCTDSGREGEYIYRLVENMIISQGFDISSKNRRRVWIDSQTEEEILRGIKEAKKLSDYDNICASAYLRAKEDYLMGINFSRVLTLKYGRNISAYLGNDKSTVVSVGRVMTCVLGMIVRREREIRSFVKTPFYRVVAISNMNSSNNNAKSRELEWKAVQGSKYFETPYLYKENGFKEKETAEQLIAEVKNSCGYELRVESIEKKKETKNPPLLFNLAELQNECSKLFKISPDETLKITQELYEKKLVTYPRTDARVLSTAVSKEISKNIGGLKNYPIFAAFSDEILSQDAYKKIASTKYVNDKQITDHYAIIPTGQGFGNLKSLPSLAVNVYELICRRFLSIFYPSAVYQKMTFTAVADISDSDKERFYTGIKVLTEQGYLKVAESYKKGKSSDNSSMNDNDDSDNERSDDNNFDSELIEQLKKISKDDKLSVSDYLVKEGETSPPKQYNSGSLILAMENAGQLIEDEELRAQIKGSGIGTSATRAEIIKKLVTNKYIALNSKTQIVSPTLMGEMIYDVVLCSIKQLLNPDLTASWEKGLKQVADGSISADEYMDKLKGFVGRRVAAVKSLNNQSQMSYYYNASSAFYKSKK